MGDGAERSSTRKGSAAEDEVVQLTSELIQIDSSNTGELETTTGEAEAAAYVDAKLREVGYETEVVESGAPGRHNVFCRLPGADSSRPALLVHGHLDVVPCRPRMVGRTRSRARCRTATSGAAARST